MTSKMTIEQWQIAAKDKAFEDDVARLALRQLLATMDENERLREALAFIEFSSHFCPAVIDGQDVPEQWQEVIRRILQPLGEVAKQALSNEVSDEN